MPLYQNIANAELLMPDNIMLDEPIEDLLRSLLIKSPQQRVTVDVVRKHVWFKVVYLYLYIYIIIIINIIYNW